jgi:hypothetical protein
MELTDHSVLLEALDCDCFQSQVTASLLERSDKSLFDRVLAPLLKDLVCGRKLAHDLRPITSCNFVVFSDPQVKHPLLALSDDLIMGLSHVNVFLRVLTQAVKRSAQNEHAVAAESELATLTEIQPALKRIKASFESIFL